MISPVFTYLSTLHLEVTFYLLDIEDYLYAKYDPMQTYGWVILSILLIGFIISLRPELPAPKGTIVRYAIDHVNEYRRRRILAVVACILPFFHLLPTYDLLMEFISTICRINNLNLVREVFSLYRYVGWLVVYLVFMIEQEKGALAMTMPRESPDYITIYNAILACEGDKYAYEWESQQTSLRNHFTSVHPELEEWYAGKVTIFRWCPDGGVSINGLIHYRDCNGRYGTPWLDIEEEV